jgi:hypothetical protein
MIESAPTDSTEVMVVRHEQNRPKAADRIGQGGQVTKLTNMMKSKR